MICEYLEVYNKDGFLLTDTRGLHEGDIITIVVREDFNPGYKFLEWRDRLGYPLDPQPVEVEGTIHRTFQFRVECGMYIDAFFIKEDRYLFRVKFDSFEISSQNMILNSIKTV